MVGRVPLLLLGTIGRGLLLGSLLGGGLLHKGLLLAGLELRLLGHGLHLLLHLHDLLALVGHLGGVVLDLGVKALATKV